MPRLIGTILVGAVLTALVPGAARGQAFGRGGYYSAPGAYGMAYGYPAYGYPRTYTAFSSSYGAGYGYGYPPYSYLTGRYGVGLWRPGFVAPGYAYGASYYYRTFAVPYGSLAPGYPPPVGVYAPAFGPPAYVGW
jgi:hypothetical protein